VGFPGLALLAGWSVRPDKCSKRLGLFELYVTASLQVGQTTLPLNHDFDMSSPCRHNGGHSFLPSYFFYVYCRCFGVEILHKVRYLIVIFGGLTINQWRLD
jgi:hypothetical protein